MKTVFTILIFSLFIGASSAQDIKLDKLEMWFDKGNFKKAYKKSGKLIKDSEYKEKALPYFWHALAKVQIDLKKNKNLYKSLINSASDFQVFASKENAVHYLETYNNQIIDFQELYLNEIAQLKLSSPEKAKELFSIYKKTFQTEIKFEGIKLDQIKPEEIETTQPEDDVLVKGNRKAIIKTAKKYIGVPYQWGGTTPKGFDCSGYTAYVLGKHSYSLPRMATEQGKKVTKIKLNKAKPGDLVFFGTKAKITHVGIVTSNQNEDLSMIHASSSKGIMISNIEKSSYWKPRLLFVGSIVN